MNANSTEVESKIRELILDVLRLKGLQTSLERSAPLTSLGLESIDWAEVVVRMETDTGLDPFSSGATFELRTFGDFCDAYQSLKD
jgi:acyl carrier protein